MIKDGKVWLLQDLQEVFYESDFISVASFYGSQGDEQNGNMSYGAKIRNWSKFCNCWFFQEEQS